MNFSTKYRLNRKFLKNLHTEFCCLISWRFMSFISTTYALFLHYGSHVIGHCGCILIRFTGNVTRTVRGSDYSPAIELSEQKDKLVTATGDTEKYSKKQANKV